MNPLNRRRKKKIREYPSFLFDPSSSGRLIAAEVEEKKSLKKTDIYLFRDNEITTTKYTRYTFLFKHLFEQFNKLTNIYFLIIAIITFFPSVSPFGWATTVIPLIFVLTVSGIKEGYEDYQRYRHDSVSNNREYSVYNSRTFVSLVSKDLRVGDLIKIMNNESIPADVILLKSMSASNDGVAYIETSQLDGESNLKSFKSVHQTMNMSEEEICMLRARVGSETPNNNLYKFKGKLEILERDSSVDTLIESSSLTEKQLLLRGATLRNTPYVYGVVVYCGKDTKLSLNQKNPPSKFSSVEKTISNSVIGIFCFKLILVIISTVMGTIFNETTYKDSWYLWMPDEDFDSTGLTVVKTFITYFALLSFLVPMSLMVTLEVVKVSQSMFMQWDENMSYKEEERYQLKKQEEEKQQQQLLDSKSILNSSKASSTGLNNSRIPLTGNMLVNSDEKPTRSIEKFEVEGENNDTPKKKKRFWKAKKSQGHKYMHVKNSNLNDELALVHYIFSDKTGTLTENKMIFSKCSINGQVFHDPMSGELSLELEGDDQEKSEPIKRFLMVLGLCHGSIVSEGGYQSQSPDEISLCNCAKANRYEFMSRSPSGDIAINIFGVERVYRVLATMEFSSERRRMSVLIRDVESGVNYLYSKGADSVMIDRLSIDRQSHLFTKTNQDMNDFSVLGLRTLVVAMKQVDEDICQKWLQEYEAASLLIERREEEMERLHDQLERDLSLIGCTAIEDKLQDGVPETIDYLLKSNIRIWIITGDKQETAINIGYSCKLLNTKNRLLLLNARSKEACQELLDEFRESVKLSNEPFSLVVDGETLIFIVKDYTKEFLELASKGHSVICCRATPLQKAQIVKMVKDHTKKVCLSIGDGANDVSMIQEAHIGVGIFGNEGTQAARASDYALLRFRHLARLITVHGRYSMVRNSQCIKFSFYKNMAFFFAQALYSFHNGWSAQTLFTDWVVSTFNTVVTAVPPYLMALFEKDVHESIIEKNPDLFQEVQQGYFGYKSIAQSLLHACAQGIGMYICFYLYFMNEDLISDDGQVGGFRFESAYISAFSTLAVLFKVALDTKYWNIFTHIFIWLSMIVYVLISIVENSFPTLSMYKAYNTALSTFNFYLMVIIMIVIVLLPNFTAKFLKRQFFPRRSEILQENYLYHLREDKLNKAI